jgi:hypothetical protein
VQNKKSVGIVTYFAYNYGAFLQSYALQQLLGEIGYDCEIINYDYIHDRTILGATWCDVKNPLRYLARLLKRLYYYNATKKRTAVMANSVRSKLKLSQKTFKSAAQLYANPPKYDIYLTGSDQVWNPTINAQGFEIRLLDFADNETSILASYAASIGLKSLPQNKAEIAKRCLSRFSAISVREEEAKTILSSLLSINNIQRHADPSLLLGAEKWRSFCAPHPAINEPYIFVYMLANQPELVAYANKLSKELGLPILSVGNGADFNNRILAKEFLNPEEFVAGVINAEYVVSNSFHGTCFSVIFKKRARIFLPPTVQIRISELLANCSLQRLMQDELIDDELAVSLYADSDNFLQRERERTINYLESLAHIK